MDRRTGNLIRMNFLKPIILHFVVKIRGGGKDGVDLVGCVNLPNHDAVYDERNAWETSRTS